MTFYAQITAYVFGLILAGWSLGVLFYLWLPCKSNPDEHEASLMDREP